MIFILGVIPSIGLFNYWIERNCSYWPFIQETVPPKVVQIQWKLFLKEAFYDQLIYDALLIGVFGFFHSLIARRTVQNWLMKFIPPQLIRGFFVIFTGISMVAVTLLWDHTKLLIWNFEIVDDKITEIVRISTFWFLQILCLVILS